MGIQILEVVHELEMTRNENTILKTRLAEYQRQELILSSSIAVSWHYPLLNLERVSLKSFLLQSAREKFHQERQYLIYSEDKERKFELDIASNQEDWRYQLSRLKPDDTLPHELDQFFLVDIPFFVKCVNDDRCRLLDELRKESERSGELIEIINASERMLAEFSNISKTLPLPNKISKVIASIEAERAIREKYEVLLKSDLANKDSYPACGDNTGIVQTASKSREFPGLPSELQRNATEKLDNAVLKIEEVYRADRRRLIMLFDEERDLWVRTAKAKLEAEVEERRHCERKLLDATTALGRVEDELRTLSAEQSKFEVPLQNFRPG